MKAVASIIWNGWLDENSKIRFHTDRWRAVHAKICLSGWKVALGISNPEVNVRFLQVASSTSTSTELKEKVFQRELKRFVLGADILLYMYLWTEPGRCFCFHFFFSLSPAADIFLKNLLALLQKISWILLAISPGKQKLVRVIIAGGIGVDLQSLRLNKRRQIKNSSLESERLIMSGLRKFWNSWGEPGRVVEKTLTIFVYICIYLVPPLHGLILLGILAKWSFTVRERRTKCFNLVFQ